MNTTDLSTEASITANVSASGAKLEKEQEKEMEFDNDSDLTGFCFIDCELLVQFVGSLLCPDRKRPPAAGRHSSTTERRTGLASELTFKCGCKNEVVMLTSKKINKVYEVKRRFPLAIFAIRRHQTHGKKFLGDMNMPGSLNNTSWSNHKKANSQGNRECC